MENEFILEAPSNAELTHAAARDLTDRINTASEDLAAMLQRAHDGKAWLALGHRSWKDYLAAEIKLSKQHAHRLLEFSKTREEIQKSPMGDLPPPTSERQVRALTKLPLQERPQAFAAAVEAAGGASPTAKQVEAAVVAVRGIQPVSKESEEDPWRDFRPTPTQVKEYGLNLPQECPGRIYFEPCGDRFAVIAPLAHDRNFVFTAWFEPDDFSGASVEGTKKAQRAGLEREFADFLDGWTGCVFKELGQLTPDEVATNESFRSGPWTYNCLLFFSREEYLHRVLGIRPQKKGKARP